MSSSTSSSTSTTKRIKANYNEEQQQQQQLIVGNYLEEEQQQQLIPGLPDHLAQIPLSYLPATLLYHICRSWRRLIYNHTHPPFLSLYTLLSSPSTSSLQLASFDPISSTWLPLPQPPPHRPLLLRHPSFIARNLPIQSLSVSNRLVLLAATTHHLLPALSHPLIFHPISQQWSLGPAIPTPRRWCATASLSGALYLVSGVGSEYNPNIARSAEKWVVHKTTYSFTKTRNGFRSDESESGWVPVAELKNGRRFSREAVDGVGWRGRVCMVNSEKEGVIYNAENDAWEEMPEGMLKGWKGPVVAMDEKEMYAVDEGKGVLSRYVEVRDEWEEVFLEREVNLRMKGAVQIAAGGGRVCVVSGSGGGVVVVDVVARPHRAWVVDAPGDSKIVAAHVLPRMGRIEDESI